MCSFFILVLVDINDDIHPVYDKVKSLSAHWRSIAFSLRLRIDTINNIEASSHGNTFSCLQKVLEHWLKKDYDYKAHGVPCWQMVCVAVKEGGADPALADQIAREHPITEKAMSPINSIGRFIHKVHSISHELLKVTQRKCLMNTLQELLLLL